MSKYCCVHQEEGGGIDPVGLLIALVIALVLMVVCSQPPRRRAFAVYHRCC